MTIFTGDSLDHRMMSSGMRPSGFDYMRIILATGIVVYHTVLTSYGVSADEALWQTPARPFLRPLLPIFFALSGFLVAGSLLRTANIFAFLKLRALRIYPALIVEVVISAFLLGPIVTSYPLYEYFTDPLFFRYILNATGHISYFLPGVFEGNPDPRTVNAQLWTVPFELECYIVCALLAVVGIVRHRSLFLWTVIALIFAYFVFWVARYGFEGTPRVVKGRYLVLCFLAGMVVFLYRDTIVVNCRLVFASLIGTVVPLSVVPIGELAAIFPVAYLTAALGTYNPSRRWLFGSADYSYGVFLYGFVIQQTVVWCLPMAQIWWVNAMVSLPLAFIVAAISWHLVEKPALRLKGRRPQAAVVAAS